VAAQIGKYTILGTLGTGASGTVYLARDDELDRQVAVKQLAPELAAHTGFADLFRQEAEIMARLDHPNCVRVYDFVTVGPALYIVSEYVEGASLRQVLESAGRLDPEQALGVTGGALRGLAHAHELGLVHRDVKPENLLADRAGISKLADFGQAYFTGEVSGGQRQSTGSPAYMSPEQVRGDQGDLRSDVYAAGAVLYEFMSGRPPFIAISRIAVMKMHLDRDAPELSRVNPRIPARVSAAVGTALNKEPQDRYQTAGQFLAALEEVAQEAYGIDWILAGSIAGLVATVTAAAATTGATTAATASAQAGSAQTGAARVPAEPEPPAPEPPAPVPGPEAPAPTPPAEAVAETAPQSPRRGGVAAAVVAVLGGLLVGAALGYASPRPAAAPAPAPAPAPSAAPAGQPAISTISAHFDEARSTTFYQVNGGSPGAGYTWGWVKNPGCGNLLADPGGLTAGYAHNGCNQVLEASGTVGVCASTAAGSVLYQRNARYGDGSLSAADAAGAGIAGDQFSKVNASSVSNFCSTVFTPPLVATVTPLPGAASPQPSGAAAASPSSSTSTGSTAGGSGQVPGLAAAVVGGVLVAGLGLVLLRRPQMMP
jgi:hypothetical protein